MSKEEIFKYFDTHRYALKQGKGLLSRRLHCSAQDIVDAKREYKYKPKTNSLPRILIFDIESAPMKAFVWKRWKENISLDQTISESFMICWSAKWLYEDEVIGECLTPEEMINEDDLRIVKSLYELINECDILIAYNGRNFDIPYMNQRFLVYGFEPYKNIQIIDPYESMKKVFRFSSNKMDNIATQLGLRNKIDTDFNLWKGCMNGDVESLNYMLEYNKQDVKVLEDIYVKVRPWLQGHPNVSNYKEDKHCCVKCGSDDYELLEGKYYYTYSAKYRLYRCKCCGTVFRDKCNLNKEVVNFINCK